MIGFQNATHKIRSRARKAGSSPKKNASKMADRVGFHIIWSLLLLATAFLSSVGFASPFWVNEGNYHCGLVTFCNEDAGACRTFNSYGGVSDIPGVMWRASAFLVGASCVALWICWVGSVLVCCWAQDSQILIHNVVSAFGSRL